MPPVGLAKVLSICPILTYQDPIMSTSKESLIGRLSKSEKCRVFDQSRWPQQADFEILDDFIAI